MTDVLTQARELVQKRIGDLDDERQRLERALVELNGGKPKPRRAQRALPAPNGSPRRKRKGTRADQAVKLIEDKPGIAAKDIAKAMKIKPNYLYRVLGDLEKEGRVIKTGKNYSPAPTK